METVTWNSAVQFACQTTAAEVRGLTFHLSRHRRKSSRPNSSIRCKWHMVTSALATASPGTRLSGARQRFTHPEPELISSETSPVDRTASGESQAVYTVTFTTGRISGSGLSQPGAAILLTVIGENGRSVLQRLASSSQDKGGASPLRFQPGSRDEVQFKGPWVGQLAAIWVAPEAGTWRLEQARVAVEGTSQSGVLYHEFNGDDILLGDGGDAPAVELKPSLSKLLTPTDGDGGKNLGPLVLQQESQKTDPVSREAGLQEYQGLKAFLLTTTVGLVGAGTAATWALGRPDFSQAFSFGGVAGLGYLILLGRAVDQLQVADGDQGVGGSSLLSAKSSEDAIKSSQEQRISLTSSSSPAVRIALVTGSLLVAANFLKSGGAHVELQPQELLAGAAGFLTYKVAVIAAACRQTKD